MFRDRTWWIALGFGVVSVLGAARDAKACSPPPNGWFAYGQSAVPANGVVVFHYGCEEGCDPEPEPGDFTLESSDGVDVPGQVSASGANRNSHYIVFRPEEGALVEGESYTPLLPGVAYTGAFTAGPDMSLGSMVPVTHEIYSLDHVAGERVCCSGPLDSCGGMPCFHTQYDRSAVLRISWGDAAYGEGTQYAFRVDRYMSAVPEWGYADSMTYFELGDDQTGTCYTLELMRLVDGTVLNLGERCADRPADLVPGIYPTSQDAIEDSLAGCEAPPEDYEEPWCNIMAERCETGMSEISCASFEEHCSMIGAGGSSGSPGTGGSGGTTGGSTTQGGAGSGSGGSPAGTGGTDAGGRASGGSAGTGSTRGGTSGTAAAGSGGDAGAPDGASGEESENGGRTVITQGCGCSVPGKRTSLPTSLLSLLAIGWFVRRRTARAAPRS